MALSKLSGDETGIVFLQLCNPLDPRIAVDFSSASRELRAPTQALRQQLKAEYEAAWALCLKLGMRSCRELREATGLHWCGKDATSTDLALLGKLGSVLPALQNLGLFQLSTQQPDGVQRLVEGLAAGALKRVNELALVNVYVGYPGASALAAALGRGALPRLKALMLQSVGIGNAGLVALAPALRRHPALWGLLLMKDTLGDEGLTALVAPPAPAGALQPPTGVLTRLRVLVLMQTHVTDAGCAALVSALDSDALPALEVLDLNGIHASAAAKDTVQAALARSRVSLASQAREREETARREEELAKELARQEAPVWERALKMLQCQREGVPTLLGLCVVAAAKREVSAQVRRVAAPAGCCDRADGRTLTVKDLPAGLQRYISRLQEWVQQALLDAGIHSVRR